MTSLRTWAELFGVPELLVGYRGRKENLEHSRISITFRVAVNGAIVSRNTVTIEVPSFHAEGAWIELDQVLYEGLIQSRESLTVEAVAGEAGEGPMDGEGIRFRNAMQGEPSSWVGMHTPSAEQAWRFWYRVESAKSGPTPTGKRVGGKRREQ